MVFIKFDNVTLDYPIYNAHNVSLRHKIVNVVTGGKIAKNANKGTVVTALKNVSFSLNDGDKVGLYGHNGAGKTTLLRCIAGIYEPNQGQIIREGVIKPLIDVGAGLEPEMTGYYNIERMLLLQGHTLHHLQDDIKKVEEFSDLHDFLYLPVRTYSSGMMMRLIFAISVITNPDILIMDEFFSVGDDNFKHKAQAKIEQMMNQCSILVFASHDYSLLAKNCNRIFTLCNGVVEEKKL